MCDVCDVKSKGTGSIEVIGNGWIKALSKETVEVKGKKVNWYSIVINHNGENVSFPIAFCPECGKELK